MSRLGRTFVLFAVSAAAMASLALGVPAIAQGALPYTDAHAHGYIGFCDKNKHQITSGTLTDQPFVWTAVSSTSAPSAYEHGKAVLLAFQPRKEVDPGEWSGRQMTAASSFTNAKHPMSQATNADDPLLFFTQAFPPKWDGLVELRLYFGAPNTPVHQIPYPATSIRVAGDRWSVVSGGAVDCNSGKATSDEVKALPSSALVSPAPLKVAGSKGSSGPSPSASSSGTQNLAARASDAGGVGSGVVVIGLIVIAVLGGGGGGLYVLRRRRAA